MQRWFYMLGGFLVWAIHFVGIYAIASIGDVVARADDRTWRGLGLAFSVVCVGAAIALLAQALRRPDDGSGTTDLANLLARCGAGIALVSIVWQTLPTVIGQ